MASRCSSPTSSSKTCAPSGGPSDRYRRSAVRRRRAKRQQLVAAWNAGELPLLAFHPASAGHGLNLQHGGSRMAWLSPSWSAELTEQAIARIYRPGQTRHVTIHVCVAARTVDEMKRDRVHGKMSRTRRIQKASGANLMQERTQFRLAMLRNGYQPLLTECKKAIETGWPRHVVDEAEVLSWDRSALLSTGLKLDGDLAVIDVDVKDAGLVGSLGGCARRAVPRALQARPGASCRRA